MIKFNNLKKVCEKLNFRIENSMFFINVIDKYDYALMHFYPDKVWGLHFENAFNYLNNDIKAMLIKAITKDYEDYINED